MAALFGAVPFITTYWAALPGVLELLLVRGEPFLALTLFLAHLLPTYFVEPALYSDIAGFAPLILLYLSPRYAL